MAEAITLTENEKRHLRDYSPWATNRPYGADLAALLENLGNINILTGSMTITAATSDTVAVDAIYNGGFVMVSFTDSPGVADLDVWGAVSGGTLTITLSASSTETVNYMIIVDNRT